MNFSTILKFFEMHLYMQSYTGKKKNQLFHEQHSSGLIYLFFLGKCVQFTPYIKGNPGLCGRTSDTIQSLNRQPTPLLMCVNVAQKFGRLHSTNVLSNRPFTHVSSDVQLGRKCFEF